MMDVIAVVVLGGAMAYMYYMLVQTDKALELVAARCGELLLRVEELDNRVSKLEASLESMKKARKRSRTAKKSADGSKKSGVKSKGDDTAVDDAGSADNSGKSGKGTRVPAVEGKVD